MGICLTNRFCSAPTFADDMTLLGLHASALSTLIRCAYDYYCKWRYEHHNEKSGTVVFGETLAMHGRMINTRKFFIGSSLIEETKEYTNLGIYKNYCGSFSTNIDENITKTRKKAGMLFSARFYRRRTNPLVYLKIWKQACIPCLLFGSELWNLTPSDIEKLKRCQDGLLGKFSNFLIILMVSVCKALVASHLLSYKLISESCSSLLVLSEMMACLQ